MTTIWKCRHCGHEVKGEIDKDVESNSEDKNDFLAKCHEHYDNCDSEHHKKCFIELVGSKAFNKLT